jgi:hypothetical protein
MRSRTHMLLRLLSVLLLLSSIVFAPSGVAAHTFHTSLMQMEYNASEKTVEVAVQVFSHDLENILSRRSGRSVRLNKTPDANQLTLAYFREAFTLKNRDGEEKTFAWVGMQQKTDAVWLYLEAKMPEGLDGAEVRNRIFFDLLEDQVNLVHVKFEAKKTDLVFKPGDGFKVINVLPKSK